jgi:hypothetical protein
MKTATSAVPPSPPSDLFTPSFFTYAGWLLESAAFGLFLAASAFELVLLSSLLWLPLVIWRERHRAAYFGLMPGAAFRFGIVLIVLGAAILAPVKYDDYPIPPVKYVNVPLAEVCDDLRDQRFSVRAHADDYDQVYTPITFVTTRPLSPKQFAEALSNASGWQIRRFRTCGNGSSILFGSNPPAFSLQPRAEPHALAIDE